jgi:hypothetical protein
MFNFIRFVGKCFQNKEISILKRFVKLNVQLTTRPCEWWNLEVLQYCEMKMLNSELSLSSVGQSHQCS